MEFRRLKSQKLHNSNLFDSHRDVAITLQELIWEDFNFIQEGKCEEDLPKNPIKKLSSNPPQGLVGLGCPSEATDMGFQRQSGCDRTPLEFCGMPALPLLIIGPFTEITFFSE